MEYKFKIGDNVKICKSGSGLGIAEIGKIVTITDIGIYCSTPGYKIFPPLGNTLHGFHGGFIGEVSFNDFKSKDPENFFII